MLIHPFKPIWDSESRILILGSFPSVKSREEGFYYGHPRNRFWPVMERLFDAELRNTEEKTAFLLSHHIALSDVIAQCDITKSADASIRNAVPQDLAGIISSSRISAVYEDSSMGISYSCHPHRLRMWHGLWTSYTMNGSKYCLNIWDKVRIYRNIISFAS